MGNEKTKTKNSYKNVAIPWPKKTWSKFVGGPIDYEIEKKAKIRRRVNRANPGVFGRPSPRTYAYDRG